MKRFELISGKKADKRISRAKLFVSIVLSGILLFLFQNCGSPIQVTDGVVVATSLENQTTDVGDTGEGDPVVEPPPIVEEPTPIVIIPPIIDAPPDDPFTDPSPGIVRLPIQGEWSSIAFEDNIASSNAGDRDFNDAVFNYKIAEQYNSQNMLIRIFIEVRLREKLSGNNHRLHLSLNGDPTEFFDNISHISQSAFNGEADAKIEFASGEVQSIENVRAKLLNIFSSTTNRKGEVVKIELSIKSPELNVRVFELGESPSVDYKKYRFILQNHGQNRKGIDIAEINPTDEMLSNGNGYPFGFMIPANWQPPPEQQLIDNMYPNFVLYRTWLLETRFQSVPLDQNAANWYLQ